MQSYLGDYPGARSQPKRKFIRAVQSFIEQTYENKELIIVSDGCEITKQLYETVFSEHTNIKFAYISNNVRTYDLSGDKKVLNFRGQGRKIGCMLASGEYVVYLDSDDIHIEDYLADIAKEIKDSNYPEYFLNNGYVAPLKQKDEQLITSRLTKNTQLFKRRLTEEPDKYYPAGTLSYIHKTRLGYFWQDSELSLNEKNKLNSNEDILFGRAMRTNVRKQNANFDPKVVEIYGYVICHKRQSDGSILWDI